MISPENKGDEKNLPPKIREGEMSAKVNLSTHGIYHKMIAEVEDYAIIFLNRDGFIQNWNKGAQKIKYYSEQEAVGKHFSMFYLSDDIKNGLPMSLINQAAREGRAVQEGWRKRKDGTKFWASVTITAVHGDDETEIIGFSKVTRDLTEKKFAEDQFRKSAEELKRSEERYHQMVAEVQDYAIILLNVEGVIQNWNAGAENIKGYTAEEAIGSNFERFYTKHDREQKLPQSLLQEAVRKSKATHEGWRLRKDGSKFWGTVVITALHNNAGEVIGFSKVTRDLTAKKIAEENLAAYTAGLEAKNLELEQFAYVASHDLQEPLRKIRTFSDLIRRNPDAQESNLRYLEKINNAATRMTDLIKSVLNYSRLSADPGEITHVDLGSVFLGVKLDLEMLLQDKKAVVIAEPLPIIKGNAAQLSQLFSNLISNALKFTNSNPVIVIASKTVRVQDIPGYQDHTYLKYDQYHELSFADNGIGFEQRYGDQIFTMFQRLHTRDAFEGTGIGLALCRKIVVNHFGHIRASGVPDKGATFYVYLPVC